VSIICFEGKGEGGQVGGDDEGAEVVALWREKGRWDEVSWFFGSGMERAFVGWLIDG